MSGIAFRKDEKQIISSCKINDNEPFIILRAKDLCSFSALTEYNKQIAGKVTPEFQKGIDEIVEEFRTWRSKHLKKIKFPD